MYKLKLKRSDFIIVWSCIPISFSHFSIEEYEPVHGLNRDQVLESLKKINNLIINNEIQDKNISDEDHLLLEVDNDTLTFILSVLTDSIDNNYDYLKEYYSRMNYIFDSIIEGRKNFDITIS